MTESAQYLSSLSTPIGVVQIQSNDECILSVLFVEKLVADTPTQPQVLKNCKLQLQEYFAGQRTQFELPIQQSGTAFQQEVWQELIRIPYGKTTSYLSLSKKLNNAAAIRAVGTANGKNKITIIVPCHRVIGSDGKLTGYSGGLHRKQWLLEHEAKQTGAYGSLF